MNYYQNGLGKRESRKLLYSTEDFDWYKKWLDAEMKYNHAHFGEPKEYPCKVSSQREDDPNGPYTYTHEFTYKEKIVCEHCGHTVIKWPKEQDEDLQDSE